MTQDRKTCPRCNTEKLYKEFQRNRASKDGLQYHCKQCRSLIEKSPKKRERDRKRYHNNKNSYLDSYYSRVYNLSLTEYQTLLQKQNHVCAVCKNECSSGRRLAVDHCHTTNIVRGLLCSSCNMALGLLKDDKNIILSLLEYLILNEVEDGTFDEMFVSLKYLRDKYGKS